MLQLGGKKLEKYSQEETNVAASSKKGCFANDDDDNE